jgi:hypothetical protein
MLHVRATGIEEEEEEEEEQEQEQEQDKEQDQEDHNWICLFVHRSAICGAILL